MTGFFRYGSIADDGFNNTAGVWVFAPSMIKELSSLETGRGYSPRIPTEEEVAFDEEVHRRAV